VAGGLLQLQTAAHDVGRLRRRHALGEEEEDLE